MKELKNELLKNIKINFMVIFTSIVCTLFKSKFVSSPRVFIVLSLPFFFVALQGSVGEIRTNSEHFSLKNEKKN